MYLGEEKLAEYSGGTTYFFHADHLGTPRRRTDAAGNLVESWEAYPFGEEWQGTGGAGDRHRFTGHLRDTETGHDYAGARYDVSMAARWLSADPVTGDLSNPQGLNRYAYVMNDPVSLVDRDGREPCQFGNFCVEVNAEVPPVLVGSTRWFFGKFERPQPLPVEWEKAKTRWDTDLGRAVLRAADRIEKNCGDFFAPSAPSELRGMFLSGQILYKDLGAPASRPGEVVIAQFDPHTGQIWINSNGPFNDPKNWPGPPYESYLTALNRFLGRLFEPLEVSEAQELWLIHEFAHALDHPKIVPDDVISDPTGELSLANTLLILETCFDKKR